MEVQPGRTLQNLYHSLVIIVLLFWILVIGRSLFVPLFYGLFIAIVLFPFCKKMEANGLPKLLSVSIGLLMVTILFAALLTLLYFQLKALNKDMPLLIDAFQNLVTGFKSWASTKLSIPVTFQERLFQKLNSLESLFSKDSIRSTLSYSANTMYVLYLSPVFAALFLYNRNTFVEAVVHINAFTNKIAVRSALKEIVHTYSSFIKGMIKVYVIVGSLNSLGLLILGIPHAIAFGYTTAIMTIIPYIGILLSALLPISVAWLTTGSLLYPFGVILIFTFVQYLEGNIIFPKVVGVQLKISTWATLVAIIAGGILWGVSGMILFIPFLGILKIICSYVPGLKPIEILIGRRK